MITMFTSVGKYEIEYTKDGGRQPIIISGNQRYEVCIEEFILWSSLIWNIFTRDELEKIYDKKIATAHVFDDRDFEHYLKRLQVRGLIVSGTDYSAIDALYQLIQNLFICPIKTNLLLKVKSFVHLTFIKKVPFAITKKIFKEDKLSKDELVVMSLVKQNLISTSELIKCVEIGVDNISNDDILVDKLYDDELTTCDNIGIFSRFLKSQQPVLDAVIRLYLKKLIIFEANI